jgi:hypothetical protein
MRIGARSLATAGPKEARTGLQLEDRTLTIVQVCAIVVFVILSVGTLVRLMGFRRFRGAPPQSGARELALPMLLAEILVLVGMGADLAGAALRRHYDPLGKSDADMVIAFLQSVAALTTLLAFLAGVVLQFLFLRRIGKALTSQSIPAKLRDFVHWVCGLGLVLVVGVYAIVLLGVVGSESVLRSVGVLLVLGVLVGIASTVLVKYLGLLALPGEEIPEDWA